jgi:hypothetical protein
MPRFGRDHFVGYALRFFVINDKTVATDFHASPPHRIPGFAFASLSQVDRSPGPVEIVVSRIAQMDGISPARCL